ncbi:MAG: hypothetical protein LBT18_01770 [Endomicrobium sp.]|jgi:hypoxanthine-guanine phosphoribosyltransferase|nr:hypothetical protein [Endomicrobium sp.]
MSSDKRYTIDVLFFKDLIQKQISAIASQISDNFKDKELLVIAVLNSFIFCADFVVRYGLDYNGPFRGLFYIGQLKGVC